MRILSKVYLVFFRVNGSRRTNPDKKLSIKTVFHVVLISVLTAGICNAQGPNPQTGMRVIGTIKLSSSCEKDTLRMENLTKDSAKTVKFYVHSYNYFNNPFYPNYKDTIYSKANGAHVYEFTDSMVTANCFRYVNLYFGIIAYDTFGIDYPVISRITIYLRPRAIFVSDSVVCEGDELQFTNNSCSDSTKFKWVFSDTTINGKDPGGKSFSKPGKQKVKLIANTSTPCALIDTMTREVNVLKLPVPKFKITYPDFTTFYDSMICLGDTLFLVNTSANEDSINYILSPPANFSLAGGSKLSDDTVRLVMVQKGHTTIEMVASNKACSRSAPKRKLLIIQNPYVKIKPLQKCQDSLWIDLDKFVDTSTGVPKKVVWTIKGNGLNMTMDTLFPGILKNLTYGKYVLKVISIGGCRTLMSTDSFFVSPPVISPNTLSLCFGLDTWINLNKSFTLPKGFIRKWTGPVTNDSFFSSKGKSSGIYIPTLIDLNSNCYNLPVKIEVIGNGMATIPDQHLCSGTKIILPLDSFMAADYKGKGVINDTFYHSITGPGTFPVKYTTVFKSCVFTDSLKIFVHDTFTPQFSFITPGCQDSIVSFQKITKENTVLWDFGDGTTSNLNNPGHIFKTPGNYKVKLVARTHCPDSLAKVITIYPSPSADLMIRTDTSGCDSVIMNLSFVNRGFGEKYSFTYGSMVYNGDSIRLAVAKSFQAKTIIITGTVVSKCGSKTDNQNVNIPQRNFAAIEIVGLNPGCHGDSLKLVNLTYGPADSFIVDYGNGIFSKNKVLKLPYFNNTTMLKDYTIVLKVYSKFCGILIDTTHYKVIPNVIRAAGEHNKKKLCNYEMVTFINNCTQGTDFNLFFGDGGSTKGNIYHQAINYQYMLPGVYVPYIKAISACGSDSVLLDTIKVNGAPKVTLSNARSKMCLGSEIYLKYSPSSLLNPKWFVNYALTDSLVNPFKFHPKSIGKYKITVVASNQFCLGLDSFEINVEAAPDIKISVNEVTCDTMRVVINGNYKIGNLEVNWGDGITDYGKLYHVYNDTGNFLIKITLVEGLCTLYFEREIFVKTPPRFNLLMHPALKDCLNPGDTLNMFVELDSLPYQVDLYNWAGVYICSNCERRIKNINYMNCEPKAFKVVVKDKDNCRTEKEIEYACFDPNSIKYKAFIPNAFTPKNGDLLNDMYLPHLTYYDSGMDYNLKIYDRWGEKLFESSDPDIGWDGTYKGNVSPMDVYVYVIVYGCPGHKYNQHKGTLHLLR